MTPNEYLAYNLALGERDSSHFADKRSRQDVTEPVQTKKPVLVDKSVQMSVSGAKSVSAKQGNSLNVAKQIEPIQNTSFGDQSDKKSVSKKDHDTARWQNPQETQPKYIQPVSQ